MADQSWTVSFDHAGGRLDKFLADPSRLGSRGRSTDSIQRGKVFVNGVEMTRGDAARILSAGDQVRVWMDRPGTASRRDPGPVRPGEIRVVFDDGILIVVDKPAGLLTVPLERRPDAASVQQQLVDRLRSHGKRKPLVVHRIDRDTSGLVVFAMRPDAQRKLKDQFRRHEPERVYLAVVYGQPSPESGVWRDRLVWDAASLIQKETHPRDPRGKWAESRYRVLERFAGASLIEVQLITGKRNQIRLQARLRGHTLVGEERYVYGSDELRPVEFPRQALHAFRLGFCHPVTGERLRFEVPMPRDIAELVDRLRRVRQG